MWQSAAKALGCVVWLANPYPLEIPISFKVGEESSVGSAAAILCSFARIPLQCYNVNAPLFLIITSLSLISYIR